MSLFMKRASLGGEIFCCACTGADRLGVCQRISHDINGNSPSRGYFDIDKRLTNSIEMSDEYLDMVNGGDVGTRGAARVNGDDQQGLIECLALYSHNRR